jgi:hypothetical protein
VAGDTPLRRSLVRPRDFSCAVIPAGCAPRIVKVS